MCGIAGILEYAPSASDMVAPLERMKLALRHRGPDDEGIFLSSGEGARNGAQGSRARCGLVHTRLSILDLSPAGHQPMSTSDGRYWITFNGEIYNFQKLRQQLEERGVCFRSHSDTEVILYLYQIHGPACVDQLVGMFAFAIWDAKEETCFLARDPLGIKPLYYFQDGTRFLFASELRTLVQSGEIPRRISPSSLYRYLLSGSLPTPESLIDGVQVLGAGRSLTWRRGEATSRQFWRLQFYPKEENEPLAAALTRNALMESLRRHFVSDVPVGLFLSGGMDSTALLALAQQLDHAELKTFCISFNDPRFNEGDVARRTAEYFGASHFDWRLDARTGASMLEEFLSKIDQPTIDGFNTFCVSKHAHNHGIKAVLSGLGGDEIFGGYGSFRNVPRLYRWSQRLESVAPLRATGGHWLESASRRAPFRRLGSYLQKPPSMAGAYKAYRGVYTPAEAALLVRLYIGEEVPDSVRSAPEEITPPDACLEDEVSRLEIENYMRFQLLRDSDGMSMAWGLELRVPFVDRQLMESLAAIPASQRLAPKKGLLLQAVPEIPDWVSQRPKQGFLFPFENWLADEWKPIFDSVGKGSGVRVQTWYQKWSLFVLKRWCESMNVPLSV